jgi:hypothetical protein
MGLRRKCYPEYSSKPGICPYSVLIPQGKKPG